MPRAVLRVCFASLPILWLGFALNIALVGGCRKMIREPSSTWQQRLSQQTLNELQFTQIVAEQVKATNQNANVQVVTPLTISVDLSAGETTCDLANLWNTVQQSTNEPPEVRVKMVNDYVGGLSDTLDRLSQNTPVDIEQIVPLIKSQKWLEETDKRGMNLHRESLVGDLFVIFAEDGPNQLRFIDRTNYNSFGLAAAELRAKAIANLRTRIPEPKRHGTGPLYMLAAGGVFESSLLLCPDVWNELDAAVDGRLVATVPSRELLIFTGENAPEAIQQMRAIAENTQASGSYLVSKELLIRTEGRWQRLADRNEVPKSPATPVTTKPLSSAASQASR